MDLKRKIRNIPDFPQKGIIFRDIAPLFEDKKAFTLAINQLVAKFRRHRVDNKITYQGSST